MQCDGPQKQVILNSVKNKLSKSAIVILLMLVTHQRHTGTCFNRYISDTLSLVAVDFDTQEPNRQHCVTDPDIPNQGCVDCELVCRSP